MEIGDRVYMRRNGRFTSHRPHRGNYIGRVSDIADKVEVRLANGMFGTVVFEWRNWA